MRKLLILAAILAVSVGVFSPAQAAQKKFSVSGYADNRKMDLDSASGGNRSTQIHGKVRGGKVKLKGKTVAFYATNTDTAAKTRRYLGTAKLSSKGAYTKTFAPPEGGGYLIEIVKKAGGGRGAAAKRIRVEVFEWPILDHFYRDAASNPDPAAPLVTRADKEQSGTGKSPTERWSTSYAIAGGGSAVFDITGFKCWRFNLKLAVAQASGAPSGTFTIAQGARILATQTMTRGDAPWEPSRSLSETLDGSQPLVVSVLPTAATDHPVRFILGNPKASCTFPTKSAPYR